MKKILLISVALVISACSTVNFQDPAASLAIQYGTRKYIEAGDSQKRAEKVIAFVEEVTVYIDLQAVPLSQVKLEIIKRIRAKNLSPADTLLASALVNMVDLRIQEDIGKGLIGPEDRIRINAALDLIKQAAGIYL